MSDDLCKRALDELDGSDFSAVREHARTLRATIERLRAELDEARGLLRGFVRWVDEPAESASGRDREQRLYSDAAAFLSRINTKGTE